MSNLQDIDFRLQYERLEQCVEDLRRDYGLTRALSLMAPLRYWVEARKPAAKYLRERLPDERIFRGAKLKKSANDAMLKGVSIVLILPETADIGFGIRPGEMMFGAVAEGMTERFRTLPPSEIKPSDFYLTEPTNMGLLTWLSNSIIAFSYVNSSGRIVRDTLSRIDAIEILANGFQALHSGEKQPPPKFNTERNKRLFSVLAHLVGERIVRDMSEEEMLGKTNADQQPFEDPRRYIPAAHMTVLTVADGILNAFRPLMEADC